MNGRIQSCDIKMFHLTVPEADHAACEEELVHPICSTPALAQAVQWASRLFVMEMEAAEEETG